MTIATTFLHPVAAPPVVPYRFGIFSVVTPRNADLTAVGPDEHWRNGITWQTQACHEARLTYGPCLEETLVPDDYCEVMQFDPFTVYVYNNDAVPGRSLDEHRQDTLDRFLAGEQAAVENEARAKIGAVATNLAVPTTYSPLFALAALEQQIATNYGGQGIIWMDRQTATLLWESLRVEGGKLVTTLGTPVVAWGGQIPANVNAAPQTAFMYATGAAVMYRGEIDTREWAIDKAINRGSWIAQRDYVFGVDCGAVYTEVTITNGQTYPVA